jgi:hypothetical protein
MSILKFYSIKNEENVHMLKYFLKFEGQIQCQNAKIKAFDSSLLQIYLHNNIYFGCQYFFLAPHLIILHMVSYCLFTYMVGPKEKNYIFTYKLYFEDPPHQNLDFSF